jgi:hypothetical protein
MLFVELRRQWLDTPRSGVFAEYVVVREDQLSVLHRASRWPHQRCD